MGRRPDVPAEVRGRIDGLVEQADAHLDAGDLRASVDLAEQAWELLPEPKASWDYYPQTLAVGLVEDYVTLGDLDAATRWIDRVFEVYDDADRTEHYPLMVQAKALDALGRTEEATGVFARIHDLYGARGFRGEHAVHLSRLQGQSPTTDAGPGGSAETGADLDEQVDRLCAEGEALMEAGDHAAALDVWQQALTLLGRPGSRPEARMWLNASIGDAFRVLGDTRAALTSFELAHDSGDGAVNPFVLIGLGASLVDVGREDEAADPLLRAYMLEGDRLFDDFGGDYLEVLRRRGLLDDPGIPHRAPRSLEE